MPFRRTTPPESTIQFCGIPTHLERFRHERVSREHSKRELVLLQEGLDNAGVFIHIQGYELNFRAILVLVDEFL